MDTGGAYSRLQPKGWLRATCPLPVSLDLVFIESKEILKAHAHKKRQIIEAAFCFLPTHLSCSQELGFSFALELCCDRGLPTGCSVLSAVSHAGTAGGDKLWVCGVLFAAALGAAFCGIWGDLVPEALRPPPAAQDWLLLGTRRSKGDLTCYGSSVSKAAAHHLSSVPPCTHTSAAELAWALL